MGILKEPSDIDFFVDPKPLTKEETKKISDFIKLDKKARKLSGSWKRHMGPASV